jgi:sec-independent protein translocase protein TatA
MLPFGIQPWHILVLIVVAFLIFGGGKLPDMGRSLGKTLSEFRKGTKEAAEGFKEEIQKPAAPTASSAAPLPPADPFAPAQTAPVQSAFPQTAQPAGLTGNFCNNCGKPNLPEAHFCANCGAKLPEKVV